MNSYFSRAEKTNFVQLTVLAGIEEQIIEMYSAGNNADKEFLKLLRTSKTWLMKALDYRTGFLSDSAKIDLARQVAKLDLIFVPNDVAKKEYELLKEVQTHVHMPIEDFEDWYCEVIKHTCKTCAREDYRHCAMRCVMAKHGVFPANPAAKDTCQYSYVGADPSELPPPRPPREIVDDEYNEQQAVDCLLLEAETTATEEGKESEPELVPVEIYLASGVQLALEVPQHMAEQLLKGMKGLPKHNRPVCACHVGKELIAVDTQEVAVFRARGIGECELERSNNPMGNQNALPSRNAPAGSKNAVQRSIETAAFKIECKCGADYFCQLSSNSPKARCRDCGAPVYTDWEIKDVFPGTGEEATLMTNRYFVEQKGTRKESEWKKKEISGPTLGQYREPCKIFE